MEIISTALRAPHSPLQSIHLKVRLYRLLCLCAAFLCIFVVLPSNYICNLSVHEDVAVFLFAAASCLLYRESRKGRHHVRTFLLLLLLVLNGIWFSNGASQGSVCFYYFPACMYAVIFFEGRQRWFMLALCIADAAALLGVEHLFPHLAFAFHNQQDRLVDLICGMITCALICALMVWVILADYESEQKRLVRLIEELKDNIAERREAERALRESESRWREAEHEIRELNRELDQRVRERTALLEAAIREQESFSYSVSHDLRGPLRHINSYCCIVEDECGDTLPTEARKYLEKVRNSSSKLGQLIDDLLEMSRISRYEVRREPVDLSAKAREICLTLKESEAPRHAEFIIEDALTAHGDRVLLRVVLENLLGNAWKYTSRKEETRIEVGCLTGDGCPVFYVKDNGTGFDMSYKDHLFGAFQRLHGAEYEGTGIGLATVKRIIERHEGAIWAEAEVGRGTTMFFTVGPQVAHKQEVLSASA